VQPRRVLKSGESIRCEMKPFTASQLPSSPAGRMQILHELLAGTEIVDENGDPTGERTEPLITKADFVRLMNGIK
jgi:hypothetical protein